MAKAVGHGLGIGLANGGDKAVRRQGINLPVAEIGLADGWGLGNSRWEGWVLRPWRSTGGGVLAQPDLLCCIMRFGQVWEESPAVQHVIQEVRHWIVPGRSSGLYFIELVSGKESPGWLAARTPARVVAPAHAQRPYV